MMTMTKTQVMAVMEHARSKLDGRVQALPVLVLLTLVEMVP